MRKQVTVAVRMDDEFVRMLNASVTLGTLQQKDELTPIEQLALTVLYEARGFPVEVVYASVLHVWRPHFDAVTEMRKVLVQEEEVEQCRGN